MDDQQFDDIRAKIFSDCMTLMAEKGDEYAPKNLSRLHGFDAASKLTGLSRTETVAAMMVKHTIAVFDITTSKWTTPKEVLYWRIVDHINYLVLLRCVAEVDASDNLLDLTSIMMDTPHPTRGPMTADILRKKQESIFASCASILSTRADDYASTKDRLHNFRAAATLLYRNTREAVAGMMAKHIVSVYDLATKRIVPSDDYIWDEKITDSINYLVLLYACVHEYSFIYQEGADDAA